MLVLQLALFCLLSRISHVNLLLSSSRRRGYFDSKSVVIASPTSTAELPSAQLRHQLARYHPIRTARYNNRPNPRHLAAAAAYYQPSSAARAGPYLLHRSGWLIPPLAAGDIDEWVMTNHQQHRQPSSAAGHVDWPSTCADDKYCRGTASAVPHPYSVPFHHHRSFYYGNNLLIAESPRR